MTGAEALCANPFPSTPPQTGEIRRSVPFRLPSRHAPALTGVPLNHVRAELRAHPFILDADVRWVDTHVGRRLKAFAVPDSGAPAEEPLRRSLATWLRHHLNPAAVPDTIVVCKRLPPEAMVEDLA